MINEDAFDRIEAYAGIADIATVLPLSTAPAQESIDAGNYRLEKFADSRVKVYENGVEQLARPILKKLADSMGISHLNKNGGKHNTRRLGAQVIAALRLKA